MGQLVIAVRGGPQAKSRLAGVLAPGVRAELAAAMLHDMLVAAAQASRVSQIWVVTPTPELEQVAHAMQAQVIRQDGVQGLNMAFRQALEIVGEAAPYAPVALAPGDLPLLEPGDLDAVMGLAQANEVTLARAMDGGTGMLALRAGVDFPPCFGPDSFWRHQDEARRRGLSLAMVEAASLAHDMDRPEDIAHLLEHHRNAPARGGRTLALLTEHRRKSTRP